MSGKNSAMGLSGLSRVDSMPTRRAAGKSRGAAARGGSAGKRKKPNGRRSQPQRSGAKRPSKRISQMANNRRGTMPVLARSGSTDKLSREAARAKRMVGISEDLKDGDGIEGGRGRKNFAKSKSMTDLEALKDHHEKRKKRKKKKKKKGPESGRSAMQRLIDRRSSILSALENDVTSIEVAIHKEKEAMAETGGRIQIVNGSITDVAHELAGYSATEGGPPKGGPPIAKLTSQLHMTRERKNVAVTQFNEVRDSNLQLRAQINDMRREKLVYERAFGELEEELARNRRETESAQNEIELHYKQRDIAQLQLGSAEQEFLKSQAKIHQELAAVEAKAQRMAEANEKQEALRRNREINKKKKPHMKRMNTLKQKIIAMGKKDVKGGGGGGDLGYYSGLWHNIKERTGLESVDELVSVFMKLEQAKISRVKEANAYIQQIRGLKSRTKEMNDEAAEFVKNSEERMSKRKDFIRNLEVEVDASLASLAELQNKNEMHAFLLRSLSKPMKSLADRLNDTLEPSSRRKFGDDADQIAPGGSGSSVRGASRKSTSRPTSRPVSSAGGAEGDVGPQQLLQWMAFVEQRTTELLQFYTAATNQGDGSSKRAAPSFPSTDASDAAEGDAAMGVFPRGAAAPSGQLKVLLEQKRLEVLKWCVAQKEAKSSVDNVDRVMSRAELQRAMAMEIYAEQEKKRKEEQARLDELKEKEARSHSRHGKRKGGSGKKLQKRGSIASKVFGSTKLMMKKSRS